MGSFPPFAGTSSAVAVITRLERELAAANSEVSRLKAILPEAAPRGTYDEVQKSGPDQSAQDVANTSADPPRLPPAARASRGTRGAGGRPSTHDHSELASASEHHAYGLNVDQLSRKSKGVLMRWLLMAWNGAQLHDVFIEMDSDK